MQPLFTIHAGEFLVGDYIQRTFAHTQVWIPAKDTGVDLLVTDQNARRTVSLQVKYSRDYLVTHAPADLQEKLVASGWWTFDLTKIRQSRADYWVLLLVGFNNRSRDFIVIRPLDLARRLRTIHKEHRVQSYFCVTKGEKRRQRCWETRGLTRSLEREVIDGAFREPRRDFTRYLNNWEPIRRLDTAG